MTGPIEREAAKQALRERIARSRMVWREMLPGEGTRRERAASPRPAAGGADGRGEGHGEGRARAAVGDGPLREPADRGTFPRSQTLRWLSTHPAAALVGGIAAGVLLWSGAPRRAASWARPAAAAAQGALAQTAGTVRQVREVLTWLKPALPVLAALLAARAPAATARPDDGPAGPVRNAGASAPAGGREPPP